MFSVNDLASGATMLGVLVGAYQLRAAARSARTSFEDALAREYREIARALPISAHLPRQSDAPDVNVLLPEMFKYFDLSNQQVFLRVNGRIGHSTWREWGSGIKQNLSRPAFRACWEEIKSADSETFDELRRLEREGYAVDPRSWKPLIEKLRDWWSS